MKEEKGKHEVLDVEPPRLVVCPRCGSGVLKVATVPMPEHGTRIVVAKCKAGECSTRVRWIETY